MTTVREYFDTDPRVVTAHTEWTFTPIENGEDVSVCAKIAYDIQANAKYWYFYIPDKDGLGKIVSSILRGAMIEACTLGKTNDEITVQFDWFPNNPSIRTDELRFTRRIYMYVDANLNQQSQDLVHAWATELNFKLILVDQNCAQARSKMEQPLAFISHDSRDKDSLVRELAQELSKLRCPVWYDEYSLSVGDSLRKKIEEGLKSTRKCILVISPSFLSNEGWGQAEFDSVFTREILEKKNVILPVWHNVSVQEVYNYSPRLADKVGLSSTLGAKEIALRLFRAIASDPGDPCTFFVENQG
jgi:hypothetical protein